MRNMRIAGIDVVAVAGLRHCRASVPSLRQSSGGGSYPPGGGGSRPGGDGGWRRRIRCTPPPPSPLPPPTPPLMRYRSEPSRMTAGVAVPPERPARRTHPDSGEGGSEDGGGKNGIGGGSSTGRDNDLRCRWRLTSPLLSLLLKH